MKVLATEFVRTVAFEVENNDQNNNLF